MDMLTYIQKYREIFPDSKPEVWRSEWAAEEKRREAEEKQREAERQFTLEKLRLQASGASMLFHYFFCSALFCSDLQFSSGSVCYVLLCSLLFSSFSIASSVLVLSRDNITGQTMLPENKENITGISGRSYLYPKEK